MVNMKHIILAKNAPDRAKYTLENMGYTVTESFCLDNVQPPLAYHPDMQLVQCGKCWICAPQCMEYYKPVFEKLSIPLLCGEKNPGYSYPEDVAYNVAVTGKYALHNYKYTDTVFADNCPYIPVDVKQGYAKCSVCVVGDSAVITSDAGICKAASAAGIDTLHISAGNVSLPGYDYGFIGGASGFADGWLLFCGDVAQHPDYTMIDAFCKKHSVQIVSLFPGNLVDVGTIIAIG